MYVEYNASRAIAILVTTALLLNAMMPTLAHAATYLQGAEVNANTLVQDAYVAVTYYDSNGEQKLEKGWIDAIGETSFTIRSGALFGKKTIAYDKVLSVIMSDESTESAKQMNEVNRFIRNVNSKSSGNTYPERAICTFNPDFLKESKAERTTQRTGYHALYNGSIRFQRSLTRRTKIPHLPDAATYLEGVSGGGQSANAHTETLIRDASKDTLCCQTLSEAYQRQVDALNSNRHEQKLDFPQKHRNASVPPTFWKDSIVRSKDGWIDAVDMVKLRSRFGAEVSKGQEYCFLMIKLC